MNLMTVAEPCAEAAPSRSVIPPEERSRCLQCEGFLFWSPLQNAGYSAGPGVPPAPASPFSEGSGHVT